MIQQVYRANFAILLKAAKRGDLALVECKDAKSGETVIAVCGIGFDGEKYGITPFARMFDGNPFEDLIPPGDDKDG